MLLVSLIAHLDKEDVYLRDRFAYLVILPKGKAAFGSDWQNLCFEKHYTNYTFLHGQRKLSVIKCRKESWLSIEVCVSKEKNIYISKSCELLND